MRIFPVGAIVRRGMTELREAKPESVRLNSLWVLGLSVLATALSIASFVEGRVIAGSVILAVGLLGYALALSRLNRHRHDSHSPERVGEREAGGL
jgi:hypothetical protein